MPHRQNIFVKGFVSRKASAVEDGDQHKATVSKKGSIQYRPMLSSSDDLSLLAIESSKARSVQPLINQFSDFDDCRNEANEFASSYRVTSRYGPFSITSHTDRMSTFKKKPDTPFVCQVQNCERVDVTVATENKDKPTYICKCKTCTNQRCPSKMSKKQIIFDRHVQTFSDGVTMTTNLVDAECDGIPMCSKSECGVNTSEVAMMDTDEGTQVQEYCKPITVIEKSTSSCHFEYGYRVPQQNVYEEAQLTENFGCQCNTPNDDYDAPRQSIQCFFRRNPTTCRKYKESTSGIKNIYNEGISDDVVDQGTDLPPNLKMKTPKYKSGKCCTSGPHIPYSHKHYSKYHNNCKHPKEAYVSEEDDMPVRRCVEFCPKYVRKTCGRHCPTPRMIPSIRLPKRVLTSARNVDDYINKSRCYPTCNNTFGVQAVMLM